MLRYAITGRMRLGDDEPARTAALVEQAARLAADGTNFLQLREKDLPPRALAALARQLREALRTHAPDSAHGPSRGTRLLINSRADVAVAVRADGVHLTSGPAELTPAQVRTLYATANLPAPVVSISCHTLDEVARVAALERLASSGGDPSREAALERVANSAGDSPRQAQTLILFGPVFEKVVAASAAPRDSSARTLREDSSARTSRETRAASGSGLDSLRQACLAAAPIPVLALGGITQENTADCLAAGAAGIAAIRIFL